MQWPWKKNKKYPNEIYLTRCYINWEMYQTLLRLVESREDTRIVLLECNIFGEEGKMKALWEEKK